MNLDVKRMRSQVKIWRRKYPLVIISGEVLKTNPEPSDIINELDFAFEKFFFEYKFDEGSEKVFVELKSGIESGISYFLKENWDICGWYNWNEFKNVYVDERLKKDINDYPSYIRSAANVHKRLLNTIIFIMTKERKSQNREKNVNRKSVENESKKTNRGNLQSIFLFDDIVKYVDDIGISKRFDAEKNKINCPCWSVRGHYRHYKNGKVIFVKSYKKGKERETKEPKAREYKTEN